MWHNHIMIKKKLLVLGTSVAILTGGLVATTIENGGLSAYRLFGEELEETTYTLTLSNFNSANLSDFGDNHSSLYTVSDDETGYYRYELVADVDVYLVVNYGVDNQSQTSKSITINSVKVVPCLVNESLRFEMTRYGANEVKWAYKTLSFASNNVL